MREIEKRLIRLEERAGQLRQIREMHEPFCEFIPWSITLDLAIVRYFPEGTYQRPIELKYVSIMDGLNLAKDISRSGILTVCWMDVCAEWIHTRHMRRRSDHYTAEQIEATKQRDIRELGGVRWLYDVEGNEGIMDVMESLPQRFLI